MVKILHEWIIEGYWHFDHKSCFKNRYPKPPTHHYKSLFLSSKQTWSLRSTYDNGKLPNITSIIGGKTAEQVYLLRLLQLFLSECEGAPPWEKC